MALHATPLQLAFFLFDYFFNHLLRLFQPVLTKRTEENVDNKVVVITGANSGLGKYTAEEMAKRGAIVVMGCRNMTTGEQARNEIKEKSGSDKVVSKNH